MRIKAMDEKEAAFYKKVLKFLVSKMGFDPTTKVITLNSGDNSVIMKGEFAGHSLGELKTYIAKVEGKTIEWESEY
jgi:hypothetical protein